MLRYIQMALVITVPFLGSLGCAAASEGPDVERRQTFCKELELGFDRLEMLAEIGVEGLKSLAQRESTAEIPEGKTDIPRTEIAARAKTCALAAIHFASGLHYLVGVDRSSHIFFRKDDDPRHAKSGPVQSELFDHFDQIFDARAFYDRCVIVDEAGSPEKLTKALGEVAKLMKPYQALCAKLKSNSAGDNG